MLTKQNVEPAEYVLHLSHSFPGFIVLRFYGKLFLLNQRIFHFLSVFFSGNSQVNHVVAEIDGYGHDSGQKTSQQTRARTSDFLDLAV